MTGQISSDDWEKNVDGLAGLARLLEHHPDTVIAEYQLVAQLLLKQVTWLTECSPIGYYVIAEYQLVDQLLLKQVTWLTLSSPIGHWVIYNMNLMLQVTMSAVLFSLQLAIASYVPVPLKVCAVCRWWTWGPRWRGPLWRWLAACSSTSSAARSQTWRRNGTCWPCHLRKIAPIFFFRTNFYLLNYAALFGCQYFTAKILKRV